MSNHLELKPLRTYPNLVPLILTTFRYAGQSTYVVVKVLLVNYHSRPQLAFKEFVNPSSVFHNQLQRARHVPLKLNAKLMFAAKDAVIKHYLLKALLVMTMTPIYVLLASVVWENVLSNPNPVLL